MQRLVRFFRQSRRRDSSRAAPAGSMANPAAGCEDANTVVVAQESTPRSVERPGYLGASSTSERLSWPARDKSKQEDPSNRGIAGVVRHDAPTQRVDVAAVAKLLRVDGTSQGPPGQAETQLIGKGGAIHHDPVVGWVVIIEGPGKGRSLELGVGANHIGRAPTQKICLDFGDATISREHHSVLIYEPSARRFILQRGDVRNLTYVGETAVVEPVELRGGETIGIGETRLRFVPFCSPEFSWS
jgi:FHA domain